MCVLFLFFKGWWPGAGFGRALVRMIDVKESIDDDFGWWDDLDNENYGIMVGKGVHISRLAVYSI